MKIGNVDDRGLITSPDSAQAAYWMGPIKRAEAQKIFDEFGNAIASQAEGLVKLDLIISYIMDKFQISPEECSAWCSAKMQEAMKKQQEVYDAEKARLEAQPLVKES